MQCYDCALKDSATPAIAVCDRCGCGVCLGHAHVSGQLVRHLAGMGQSCGDRPARRMTCPVCHEAEALAPVRRTG
ncbi:DUF2180 family protein [Streptomyces sp. NPDC050095]|uniref:DUF2180 family protein n=1 Tax=unclassified Streptomyces TaxID=2593676 RepID=UPI003431835C